MKGIGRKSITCSFKADRRLADIIETSEMSLYTLVEAGLLSMAKTPGSKNNQLLQEVIRLEEDKIALHTNNLAVLMKMKDNLPMVEQPLEKAPIKVKADILVHGKKTNALYWVTKNILKGCDLFIVANFEDDAGDDYEQIFDIEDIPECEI